MHIEAALKLLSQAELAEAVPTNSRLRAQIAMLAWWDVTVAIVSRREPRFPIAYLDMIAAFNDRHSWDFFTLNGCPIEFVRAMAKLAKLASIYEKTRTMEWTIFNTIPVDGIVEEVREYKNVEETDLDDLDEEDIDVNVQRSRYLCIEAWRHAILLYVCRVFNSSQDAGGLRRIDYHSRHIFDSVRCIPETDFIQKQLLLPVFLAGAEAGSQRDRDCARDYCAYWNAVSRFGHFASAGQLLNDIWEDWSELTRSEYWWGMKVAAGQDGQWTNSADLMPSEVLLG